MVRRTRADHPGDDQAGATLIGEFPHRRAAHCASGSLRDLLDYHHLSYTAQPVSEAFVFGLAGGLGFGFAEFAGLEPPFILLGRTGDLEKDFCRNLELRFSLLETDDEEQGWRNLRERLDRGVPTMIWADMKYLDYLRVRMHNTHHTVVVVGYDLAEGVVNVCDNDRDEFQLCSIESLARARNSQAFPYGPNRNGLWDVDFPDRLPDAAETIARGVHRTVENMVCDDERLGLGGVRGFGSSYPNWPETFGTLLPQVMKGLDIFIRRAGTGGAMFRSLHTGFLEEAATLLGTNALADALRIYRRLTEEWRALASAAQAGDAIDAHRAGVNHVERIVELEREGVEAMQAWLSSESQSASATQGPSGG
jgi:Butirosin biosynthesis protein H, N-terminal/Domain of unknown function (DUF4872)